MKDRCDYRAETPRELLTRAQEGLNEELAIAIAEKLAERAAPHLVGTFHFNRSNT